MIDRIIFAGVMLLIIWAMLHRVMDEDAMIKCQSLHSRDVCLHLLSR